MAKPRQADWTLLKRIGRYLVGAPRLVQTFVWQDGIGDITVHTDSDWAGCRTTCRSTSGGAMLLGGHCVKTWSSTQATVALSSAEAELYALTKGAAQVLGLISLMEDFGVYVTATVHADASAAIGIVRRAGLGKLRHLNVRYLWLQDQVKQDGFDLFKVPGLENPADLMTKNLGPNDAEKHIKALFMERHVGRATAMPTLSNLYEHYQNFKSDDQHQKDEDGGTDELWQEQGSVVTRSHQAPRRCLFTPRRVAGAPPCAALTPLRETTGVFIDDGTSFTVIDTWTARSTAHRDLGRLWTGSTKFVRRMNHHAT